MRCPECGEEVRSYDLFCPECGEYPHEMQGAGSYLTEVKYLANFARNYWKMNDLAKSLDYIDKCLDYLTKAKEILQHHEPSTST